MATSPIACLPLVEASCERAFAPLHAARLRSRTFVVVAEEMQHAVDQQPIQLRPQRRGPLGRLAARAVERDDDVAQQAARRPPGALGLGERQDVGRPVLAAPVPVQAADDGIRDQDEGELGIGQPQRRQQAVAAPRQAAGDRGRAPAAGADRDGGVSAPGRFTGARRQR
jgi:hypothetical protein